MSVATIIESKNYGV